MTTAYRFTVADLPSFPDDGRRYEVVDGELYVSSAPHGLHQGLLDHLIIALGAWNNRSNLGWLVSGTGIICAADSGVIPDLVWVSHERLPRVVRGDGKLHGALDLVVEVLSPGPDNERRDREVKLKLYSVQGVREYWIVDRETRSVQLYRRQQAALTLAATLTVEDELTSPLLPGFGVPVDDLFRAPAVNF